MKASPGKCQLLLSTKNPDRLQMTSSIAETLLGIRAIRTLLDSELNFENHRSAECNKVSRKINALGRIAS